MKKVLGLNKVKVFGGIWCLKQKHLQLFLFSLQANAYKLKDTSNPQEMQDKDSHSSYAERIQNPICRLSKATVALQVCMQVEKFLVVFP